MKGLLCIVSCLITLSSFGQGNFKGSLTYSFSMEGFLVLKGDTISSEDVLERAEQKGESFNNLLTTVITDGETAILSVKGAGGQFLFMKDSGYICVKEDIKSKWKKCNDTLVSSWAPKTYTEDSIVIVNRDTSVSGYLCMHIRVYGTPKLYYDVFISNDNRLLRRGYYVGGNCSGFSSLLFNDTDYFPIVAKFNFGGIMYVYTLEKITPLYIDDGKIKRPKSKRMKEIKSF